MMRRRVLLLSTTAFALSAMLCGCDVYDANLLTTLRAERDGGPIPTDPYIILCGNGVVDPNEKCDTRIDAGEEGACPTECPSEDPCRLSQRVGDNCQSECFELQITRASTGDGCCPEGIGPDEDGDCGSCGDKIVSPSETCDPPEKCPTQGACSSKNSCLKAVFTGAPETCTARCSLSEVTLCEGGDECCPAGCSAESDGDCSASCGNGVVESSAGESCEVGDATLPCAQDCDDGDACTSDVKTGSVDNCNVVCDHMPIVTPVDGDGCCPAGENQVNDSDCSPVCGNEVVESGESCDPCPSGCTDSDACTVDASSGSAGACTLVCTHTAITTPIAADGCCPSGANALTDSDCSPFCGNNVREGSEACDPCPSSCNDSNACTSDSTSGSASNCSLVCGHTTITATVAGDGCCPSSANYSTDSDCPAVCGNNVREGSEKCDPCPANCNDSNACTTDSSSGSAAACSLVCTHTNVTSASSGDGCCPSGANATTDSDCSPVCGNNVREGSETCDPCPGSCNDGVACTTDGSSGSAGACTLVCSHTAITAPSSGDGCCPSGTNANVDADCNAVCGNGVVEAGEACDGQAYCNGSCNQVLQTSIAHRYKLTGTGTTVTDSVGTAHGSVVGASLSGSGTVVLTGGTSGPYINLPNGIISSLTNATVEVWLTWAGGVAWQRAFDFGNNSNGENNQGGSGASVWFLTTSSTVGNSVRMVLNFTSTLDDVANDTIVDYATPLSQNVRHQLVGVFDDSNDTARMYIDGVLRGTQTGVTGHLSSIDDRNVWIGRSNYNDAEFNGTIHEVRIYSAALSTAQVSASYSGGPDP